MVAAKNGRRNIGGLAALGCLILLLVTGCVPREHTQRVTDDWGRAVQIGVASQSTPAGLAVLPDGSQVFAAWPVSGAEGGEPAVRFVALNAEGGQVAQASLPVEVLRPRDLRLLLDAVNTPAGALHLFWIDGTGEDRQLWHSPLSHQGELLGEPRRLSPAGYSVETYCPAVLPSGAMLVMWDDASGLSLRRFDGTGAPEANPLIIPGGTEGSFQVGPDGVVHVAWQVTLSASRRAITYAKLDQADLSLSAPVQVGTAVVDPEAPPGAVKGPVVGLESREGEAALVYVAWTQQVTTMMGRSERLYFSGVDGERGQPAPGTDLGTEVNLPPQFPPTLEPATGAFAYQGLARPATSAMRGTVFNQGPEALAGGGDEVVLAMSTQFSTRSREAFQPALIYFDEGAVSGYQAVTWTDHPSVDMALAADGQRNLYLAWTDVTGEADRYPVYLATTADRLQSSWSRLSWNDYKAIGADLLNRIVSGLSLLPLAAIWLAFPFVWLFLAMWASRGDLYGRRAWFVLVVALLVYVGSKYLLTFDILTHVPKLAYLPPETGRVLIYAVPVLTLLASLGLTSPLWLRRRGEGRSPVLLYIVIAAVDMVLSVSVYAIGYFE